MKTYEVIVKSTVLERHIVEAKSKKDAEDEWSMGSGDYQETIDQFDTVIEEVKERCLNI